MGGWLVCSACLALRLVALGVGETVEVLEKTDVLATVASLFGPQTGPFGVLVTARAGGLGGPGGAIVLERSELLTNPAPRFTERDCVFWRLQISQAN